MSELIEKIVEGVISAPPTSSREAEARGVSKPKFKPGINKVVTDLVLQSP